MTAICSLPGSDLPPHAAMSAAVTRIANRLVIFDGFLQNIASFRLKPEATHLKIRISNPIKPRRVTAEHRLTFGLGPALEVIDDDRHGTRIGGGDRTHGPVGTRHEAPRAEDVECDIEIWRDLIRRPRPPV